MGDPGNLRARMYVGDPRAEEAFEIMPAVLQGVRLAFTGKEREAREALMKDAESRDTIEAEAAPLLVQSDLISLQAAILLRDVQLLKTYLAHLRDTREDFLPNATIMRFTSIHRVIGDATALLGDFVLARDRYEKARETCQRIGHRPELALATLSLAKLLLEHYPDEHDTAIEHLDFAIAEFQAMKMRPALERALRHRGLLKA